MTMTIPFTSRELWWHLQHNVIGLTPKTIDKIVEQCNLVNMGELSLDDEIAPGSNTTVAEMLEDLKIEFNDTI